MNFSTNNRNQNAVYSFLLEHTEGESNVLGRCRPPVRGRRRRGCIFRLAAQRIFTTNGVDHRRWPPNSMLDVLLSHGSIIPALFPKRRRLLMSSENSKLCFAHWENRSPGEITRAAATFILLLMFFRLLVLALLPLDLAGDEAYYWEWGRHLDLGYFSKPPGIGWLMGLAGAIGGDTTFGVRMFAVFLGTGTLWFVFRLSQKMYGPGVAMIAAIAFVANPANAALNLVLTIDAPLIFFWTLTLYAFWQFIQPGARAL